MYSLALAQDIYRDTARSTRGQKFSAVAKKLNSQADTLEAQAGDAQEVQRGVTDTLDDMSDGMREKVDEVFEGDRTPKETIHETVEHLREGAQDLLASTKETDMENVEHGDQTLAQAQLSQSGTETGDAEKMAGENSVVDKEVGIGAAAHENEHTQQKQQTVGSVSDDASVDEMPVSSTLDAPPNDGTVTATQLEEAGAIIEQKRAAPQSFDTLTQVYKDTYHHVLSHVPDESRIVELARQSDGLETLQKEYMTSIPV